MNLAFALPAVLTITVIVLFLTSPFLQFPNLLSNSLHQCGHVVLITAPRHGSTWFLDSVEGRPSRKTEKGSYSQLIKNTEMWGARPGPIKNITASEAADYAVRNCSVKIFPGMIRREFKKVKQFLNKIKRLEIPVFVLNRRSEDSYGSWLDALQNGSWGKNTMDTHKNRTVILDQKFEEYRDKMNQYFGAAQKLLKSAGLEWDRFGL